MLGRGSQVVVAVLLDKFVVVEDTTPTAEDKARAGAPATALATAPAATTAPVATPAGSSSSGSDNGGGSSSGSATEYETLRSEIAVVRTRLDSLDAMRSQLDALTAAVTKFADAKSAAVSLPQTHAGHDASNYNA